MLLGKNIVGNWKVCVGDIFEVVKVNLFPKFLIDTIIQNSSIKKRG